MPSQSYTLADTHFAYCYRVFLRCHTHRRARIPALAALDTAQLAALAAPYNIQILESSTGNTDLMLQASLRPEETVSACASKLKDRSASACAKTPTWINLPNSSAAAISPARPARAHRTRSWPTSASRAPITTTHNA